MKTHGLAQDVIELSGLPAEYATSELDALLTKKGYNPDTLTLEQLREVLADLLQDMILDSADNIAV